MYIMSHTYTHLHSVWIKHKYIKYYVNVMQLSHNYNSILLYHGGQLQEIISLLFYELNISSRLFI